MELEDFEDAVDASIELSLADLKEALPQAVARAVKTWSELREHTDQGEAAFVEEYLNDLMDILKMDVHDMYRRWDDVNNGKDT